MIINSKYDIGDELQDKVTGLRGVVMVIAKYATGCLSYGLLPRELNNGKEYAWTWLDESRLEMAVPNSISFEDNNNGGPHPNPPQG